MKQLFFIFLFISCATKADEQGKQMIKHNFVIGGIYQHYSGKKYKILYVGYYFNKKTGVELEPVMVYQALYKDEMLGNDVIFIRSIDEFTRSVQKNGTFITRYTLIDRPKKHLQKARLK